MMHGPIRIRCYFVLTMRIYTIKCRLVSLNVPIDIDSKLRQLCTCDLLLFAFYIYRLQGIHFQLKVLQRLQLYPLVLSGYYTSVLSSPAQQKPWCKLLGDQDVRNSNVPKTKYRQVYEDNKGQLMDHPHHPTTEEQTGNL